MIRKPRGKIEDRSERGALAVEMECTALMAVAEYGHIDFASTLVVTDQIIGDEWKKVSEAKRSSRGREE